MKIKKFNENSIKIIRNYEHIVDLLINARFDVKQIEYLYIDKFIIEDKYA